MIVGNISLYFSLYGFDTYLYNFPGPKKLSVLMNKYSSKDMLRLQQLMEKILQMLWSFMRFLHHHCHTCLMSARHLHNCCQNVYHPPCFQFLQVFSDFYFRPFWYNCPCHTTNMIRHIQTRANETCIVKSYVEMLNISITIKEIQLHNFQIMLFWKKKN